jgi:hypothetical protein
VVDLTDDEGDDWEDTPLQESELERPVVEVKSQLRKRQVEGLG